MSDPWKHRSEGMKCKTCMWFVPKLTILDGTIDTPNPVYNLGRCRRHAPSMNGYPTVFLNDWCGDHKLDENKFNKRNNDHKPASLPPTQG